MSRRFRWLTLLLLLAMPVQADEPHHGLPGPGNDTVPLFDNLGSYHHPITTSSPLAQRYFDQGLRLVYAFNHDEAIRAFREAARLDPDCAMAQWGVALALGPNYNLALDAEHNQAAYEAAQRAQALAPKASEAERAYIEAVGKRYSVEPGADRKALDRAYADAMRQVAHRYPDDPDAATLFAEALMDLRPWDLWTLDGEPQPGTLEIAATLEAVLAKYPEHPGANHYYIHVMEASPRPERALPSAQRIAELEPGAGHLVHMPSHIYMRLGRYADAAEANRRAIGVDLQYLARVKPEGIYPMMYYPHNIHFLWAAASMEGRSQEALQAARDVVKHLNPEMVEQMPMLEAYTPTLLFALVRFGKWQEVLQEPAPPAGQRYTTGIWHYARGLALAATGRAAQAGAEQARVGAIAKEIPADRIIGDNTPAATLLQLAAETLAGEIAARSGQPDRGIRHLEEAVRLQDGLPYTEPPPWYYPVRQSLGAVLLQAGRAAQAEAVYREDLRRNPHNGWSLYGLAASLRAQKGKDAGPVEQEYRQAWAHADVTLTASRF